MTVTPPSVQCLLYELYATAVREPDGSELFERLVEGLARVLELPLVLVGRYGAHGAVAVEATSRAGQLWSDMQRVPERWDESMAGHGPAALARHADNGIAVLATEDEAFACWQSGARQEGIAAAASIALDGPLGHYVVELFSRNPDAFKSDAGAARLEELRAGLSRLFDDLAHLREQHLLSRALDCAGHAAFITDREGTIVWCNQAFLRFYGYGRDEVVGENPRFLKSGKQGMRYYRELWNTIRAGKYWSGETVDHDRDGRAFTVRQTVSPFANTDTLSHFLAMHDDITADRAQRRRLERHQITDPVTGLMTRAAFEAKLTEDCEDRDTPWHLLLISLREFHQGLLAISADLADAIDAQLGMRLRELLGDDDTAAVLVAGEFGIQALGQDGQAEDLVQRIEHALAQPFPELDASLVAQPRIAVARFPSDAAEVMQLINHADRQLANLPAARARL